MKPRLMPHLHLSLQAGDDLILKRMKRRHSRADAIAFCEHVQAPAPGCGVRRRHHRRFPDRGRGDVCRSLDLVDECGLTHLHVFPFSPRPGTPAARMPQLDRSVIKERAARLRAKGEAVLQRHLESQVGKTLRVLTEFSPIGHTEQFTLVRFPAQPAPGRIIDVRMAGHDGRSLIAA